MFSSPHGDFSFSIKKRGTGIAEFQFSSPHGDFSFSIVIEFAIIVAIIVFVPSRGFLFFYKDVVRTVLRVLFSSPHGDFSFSIGLVPDGRPFLYRFRPLTGISLFLYV